jgi:hypothetical protein
MPTLEHFPLSKREGGKEAVDNAILAHRLCNRIDYSISVGRSHAKDLARIRKAREKAIRRKSEKKERDLRQRIWESPSLLPGVDEPAAAAEEVLVRRAGSADLVVVDAQGKITIVECKRASNPDTRRKVIGQVFEYAGGLWKLDDKDLERSFAAGGNDLTKPFEHLPDWDESVFRSDVSRNLEAGAFRLIIAVDEMKEQLRKKLERTVTFLNCHTKEEVQVLAVALPTNAPPGEVIGEDCEGIPRLAPNLERGQLKLMNEITSEGGLEAAEGLLEWADETRGVSVKYSPKGVAAVRAPRGGLFKLKPQEVQVSLSGVIASGEPWDERTTQLVRGLDDIGVSLEGTRPRAPLELLADESRRAQFLTLMERHLETLTG